MNDIIRESFIPDLNYFNIIFGIVFLILEILAVNYVYIHYSHSKENKQKFSKNFLLFGTSMYLVVLVIKSSLALSLGMVGALSIIRFRTAVKEPEQIVQFLMITGISISIAAEKILLSVIISIIYSIISIIQSRTPSQESDNTAFFRVITDAGNEIDTSKLFEVGEGIKLLSLNKSVDNNIVVEYEARNSSYFPLLENHFKDGLKVECSIRMISDAV